MEANEIHLYISRTRPKYGQVFTSIYLRPDNTGQLAIILAGPVWQREIVCLQRKNSKCKKHFYFRLEQPQFLAKCGTLRRQDIPYHLSVCAQNQPVKRGQKLERQQQSSSRNWGRNMKFLSGHILSIKPKILINYGADYNFWNRLRRHLMCVIKMGRQPYVQI